MFFKKDEREQTARRIAIRYTYCFEVLLLTIFWITSITFKNIVLLPLLYLFGSSIYLSFSINPIIPIIASTQILIMIVAQIIINKRLGGGSKPITSGNNKFRLMDERERIVSDESAFITLLYCNILLVILTIVDIVTSCNLGLPPMIIIIELIFYSITKGILLNHYGENIS